MGDGLLRNKYASADAQICNCSSSSKYSLADVHIGGKYVLLQFDHMLDQACVSRALVSSFEIGASMEPCKGCKVRYNGAWASNQNDPT